MAAERVNHPAHYNAGGIECIDALEAATIGLEGIEAFCTANAIKYLWRWKRKNGEEDLQKAIWYINRIIDRAGKLPEERKGLFNMTENKHGFMPKQEITIGGIAFAIIQTARKLGEVHCFGVRRRRRFRRAEQERFCRVRYSRVLER